MTCTKTQLKAIVLILLIAGQDCARLHSSTLLSRRKKADLVGPPPEAEQEMREANKQCSWALTKGGCAGPGCSFRPLPLDVGLSEGCRLTDDYMLNNATHRDKFIRLSAEVLEKKSEKFKSECPKARFWQFKKKSVCYRRAGHMLHSTQLLMRAEQQQAKEEQPEIDRAIKNMASLLGDDGAYILELRQSMQANVVGIAKDIEGSFKSMTKVLSKLVTGSEAEKEEARNEIRNMRKTDAAPPTEQDQIEVNQSVQRLMEKYAMDVAHVEDGFHQIDELAQNPASFGDGAILNTEDDSENDEVEDQSENDEVDIEEDSENDEVEDQSENDEETDVDSEELSEKDVEEEQSDNDEETELVSEESEDIGTDDSEEHSEKDVEQQLSDMDDTQHGAASEDEGGSLLQMQRVSTADRLSKGLIVVVIVLLLMLLVTWLMPHFAAVFWGVLLPIFMVLIVGIILFLIVRTALGFFRGRNSGNGHSPDRSQEDGKKNAAGGKDGKRAATVGRRDSKNGRKGATDGKRGSTDGRKGANNGKDGNRGAADGRNGAKDGRKGGNNGKDGRRGSKGDGKKGGAGGRNGARNGKRNAH